MNLSIMEKQYKGNKIALYLNGFVALVSSESVVDKTFKILKSLGYKITELNFLDRTNEELPTNEANFKYEGAQKSSVELRENYWIHQCEKGCCSKSGYRLKVNGIEFLSQESIIVEITEILEKLGHVVVPTKKELITLCMPGLEIGACVPQKSELEEVQEILDMLCEVENCEESYPVEEEIYAMN